MVHLDGLELGLLRTGVAQVTALLARRPTPTQAPAVDKDAVFSRLQHITMENIHSIVEGLIIIKYIYVNIIFIYYYLV